MLDYQFSSKINRNRGETRILANILCTTRLFSDKIMPSVQYVIQSGIGTQFAQWFTRSGTAVSQTLVIRVPFLYIMSYARIYGTAVGQMAVFRRQRRPVRPRLVHGPSITAPHGLG